MTGTAVEARRNLKTWLMDRGVLATMESVLPKHLTATRMAQLAIVASTENPKLLECTPQSVVRCMIQASVIGLEVNGALGHAYLVPFKGKCTLIPGYRGLIYLGREGGAFTRANARLVYEGESFDVRYGTSEYIHHVPKRDVDHEDSGIIGAYFVAHPPGSDEPQFEFMWREEIEKIKARSAAVRAGKKDTPWFTDFGEMARKTVVRRGMKYLPASSAKLGRALELDTAAEIGENQRLDIPEGHGVDLSTLYEADDATVETQDDITTQLARKAEEVRNRVRNETTD